MVAGAAGIGGIGFFGRSIEVSDQVRGAATMKLTLAMLGILCVTFAAATDLVLFAVARWNFLQNAEFVYLLASVSNVLSSLAWWVGVVLIGFATMVRDRRAVQLSSVGSQNPSTDSQSPPSA